MSGPGAPVSEALLWCSWKVIPIDILLGPTHDLSNKARQQPLHHQLQAKSRAREGLSTLRGCLVQPTVRENQGAAFIGSYPKK